jgi:hypothetical protein
LLFGILAVTIAVKQRSDRESMMQVVQARPGTIAVTPRPDLSGQAPEDTMDALLMQAAACLSTKKVGPQLDPRRASRWSA